MLLAASLLFWGWQTGFLLAGAVMGAVLEGARWIRTRWEFSDDDFAHCWTFCTVVLFAAVIYAFTANDATADLRLLFQDPAALAQRAPGTATARTLAAVFRWLPMVFFLFVAAQVYSTREAVPWQTMSLIMRRRWEQARRLGLPPPPDRTVSLVYPYFGLCLFSASVRPGEDHAYFWGLCVLVAWALWPRRSPRFSWGVWAATLAVAVAAGYVGERGLGRLQGYLNNLNPNWFSSWNRGRFDPTRSQTSIGRIGRIKTSGDIVVRLEAKLGPPPARLREATYRRLSGRTWYSDQTDTGFESVQERAQNTYVLLEETNFLAVASIACSLPGGKALLPIPMSTRRLENLSAFELTRNALGAVLAQGPGLVVFDAFHGPGPTFDSPPPFTSGATNEDLEIPSREAPAVARVVNELNLKGKPLEQALPALGRFFSERFTYSLYQGPGRPTGTNDTPLGHFLLESRSGHCEYFATAGVLLLRELGFPARYAVGYAVHESAGENRFVVRQRDAHSWCLVWDEAQGRWREFDPTPGSWFDIERKRASPFEFISDFFSRLGFEISKVRWGQTNLRLYLLLGIVPVLIVLGARLIFRRGRRRRLLAAAARPKPVAWPGLDSEFYQIEERLRERGVERQAHEPLARWLERAIEDPNLKEMRDPLTGLLRLHYRYRFDPQGLAPQERDDLRLAAHRCLSRLNSKRREPGRQRR